MADAGENFEQEARDLVAALEQELRYFERDGTIDVSRLRDHVTRLKEAFTQMRADS